MDLPPGVYQLSLPTENIYAQAGCSWDLELKRPY
jgi:hypothetical protein